MLSAILQAVSRLAPAAPQPRALSLAARLCRRRWRTPPSPPKDCDCTKKREFPLCYKKKSCMDKWSKRPGRCPPLPCCKLNVCEKADPRRYHDEQEAGRQIEEEQLAQVRAERRLRRKLAFCKRACPKRRKKRANVYCSKCPKDHSDRRRRR